MDNGLVPKVSVGKNGQVNRLNPYCSGQWSRTSMETFYILYVIEVLILIVVDNGLVQIKAIFNTNAIDVLILIVVDNGLVLKATAKQLEDQLKS